MRKVFILPLLVILSGCSLFGANPPVSQPLRVGDIWTKPYYSTQTNAKLTYVGLSLNSGAGEQLTGQGVLIIRPSLSHSVYYNLFAVGEKPPLNPDHGEVENNGKRYIIFSEGIKSNTGFPIVAPERFAKIYSDTFPSTVRVVGEDNLPGGKAWHLSEVSTELSLNPITNPIAIANEVEPATTEIWVRKSDGYLLKIREKGSGFDLIISLSNFNSSTNKIEIPKLLPCELFLACRDPGYAT